MTFPPLTGKALKKYVTEALAEYEETPKDYRERAGGDQYFIKNHDIIIAALAGSRKRDDKYSKDKEGIEAAAAERAKDAARRAETHRVSQEVVNGAGPGLRAYTGVDGSPNVDGGADAGEDGTEGVPHDDRAEEDEARRKACALGGV